MSLQLSWLVSVLALTQLPARCALPPNASVIEKGQTGEVFLGETLPDVQDLGVDEPLEGVPAELAPDFESVNNGSALEMLFGSRRRSFGGGSSWSSPRRRSVSWSSPRRRMSWSSPRRRSVIWSSPRRRSVHVHVHEHYHGGWGWGGGGWGYGGYYGPHYYHGGYYVGDNYVGGTGTMVVLLLIMVILCSVCCIALCTARTSVVAPGSPGEPFLAGYQASAPSRPPLPVGPAPVQPQLTGAFIVALRREYVQGAPGAVGSFFESADLTEDAGRALEKVEDIIRSQPSLEDRQSAIDSLQSQWLG